MINLDSKPCLFNLIIYAHETRRLEYFQELIRTVVEKFPCRVILIKAGESSDRDQFQTELTSMRFGKDETALDCDIITLEASGNQLVKVPFVILPYLLPDLPVYLLWGQDPSIPNDILTQLEKVATRLIVDSESTDNLPQFSQTMLHKIRTLHCDVIDMNWIRCQGWRNLIAQVFDSKERIQQLKEAKSIQITYNLKASYTFYHHEIEALYLQAWLATQMNWKFHSLEAKERLTRFHYQSQSEKIVVDLLPHTLDAFGPGSVLAFEVTSAADGYFVLKRQEHAVAQVLVQISTAETCDLPYTLPLSNRNRGFTFVKELLYSPISQHYVAMLETIAHRHFSATSIASN